MASTNVRYAAYRNGAKICESSRTFTGEVSESYAKREIAKTHGVDPSNVEIISIQHR